MLSNRAPRYGIRKWYDRETASIVEECRKISVAVGARAFGMVHIEGGFHRADFRHSDRSIGFDMPVRETEWVPCTDSTSGFDDLGFVSLCNQDAARLREFERRSRGGPDDNEAKKIARSGVLGRRRPITNTMGQ